MASSKSGDTWNEGAAAPATSALGNPLHTSAGQSRVKRSNSSHSGAGNRSNRNGQRRGRGGRGGHRDVSGGGRRRRSNSRGRDGGNNNNWERTVEVSGNDSKMKKNSSAGSRGNSGQGHSNTGVFRSTLGTASYNKQDSMKRHGSSGGSNNGAQPRVSALGNPIPNANSQDTNKPRASAHGNPVPAPRVSALGNPIPAGGNSRASALGNSPPLKASSPPAQQQQHHGGRHQHHHHQHNHHQRDGHHNNHQNYNKHHGGFQNQQQQSHRSMASKPPAKEPAAPASPRSSPEDPVPSLTAELKGLDFPGGGLSWGDRMDGGGVPVTTDKLLESTVGDLNTEIIMLKNQVKSLEEEKKVLEEKTKSFDADQNKVKEALAKKEGELKLVNSANKSIKNIREQLETERDKLRRNFFQAENRVKELEEELKKAGSGGAASNAQGGSELESKVVDLTAKLADAQSSLSDAKLQIETQKLDLEYYIAQQDYMKIRIENLEADLKLRDADLDKRAEMCDDLEAQVAQLKSQLEAEPVMENTNAEQAPPPPVVLNPSPAPEDATPPVSPGEDEGAHPVQLADPSADGAHDVNDLMDEPWLFSASSRDTSDILERLEFSQDEMVTLDVSKWTAFDGFLEDCQPVFRSANLDVLDRAKSLPANSQEFWRMYCESLSEVCNHDLVIFVEHLDQLAPEDKGAVDSLVRLFVSAIAEAYDNAKDPGRFVMVLENYSDDVVGGEDPTGNGVNPRFHHVISYPKWKVEKEHNSPAAE